MSVLKIVGVTLLAMAASSCCRRSAPVRVDFEVPPEKPAVMLKNNCYPGEGASVVCDSRIFAQAGMLTLQLAKAYEQTCVDLDRCREHAANDVEEMQGLLDQCHIDLDGWRCDWWAWALGGVAVGAAVGLGVGLGAN